MNPALLVPLLLPLLTSASFRTIFGDPRSVPYGILFLVSLFVVSWIACKRTGSPPAFICLLGCLAFVVIAMVTPKPVSDIAYVGSAVLGIAAVVRKSGIQVGLSTAFLSSALVYWLSPRWLLLHNWDGFFANLACLVLNGFGLSATTSGSSVALESQTIGAIEMGVSLGHLGIRELLAIGLGTVVAVSTTTDKRLARFAGVALALLVTLALGILINAVVAIEGISPSTIIDPFYRSVVLGVPMIAVQWFFGLRFLEEQVAKDSQKATSRFDRDQKLETSDKKKSVNGLASGGAMVRPQFFIMAAMGVCLIIVAEFAAHDVTPERIRIAVDVGHSAWERIDLPLDRTGFGTRAVYNYSEWIRGLEQRHGEVQRVTGAIEASQLRNCDVFILKTPTYPLTENEQDILYEFVRDGGGLYLVGDHTDVFGMNSILNPLSQRFGIKYRSDAVFEFESDISGGLVSRPEAYPCHPLTRITRPIHWMTSCTLQLQHPAVPILWSTASFADEADFSKYNFFGDHKPTFAERIAPHAIVAAATVGRGRVLAFSDSTLFSNFSIFLPGVRELAFGGVEWLSQRPSWNQWRLFSLIFGSVCVVISFYAGRHDVTSSLLACFCGFATGMTIAETSCRAQLKAFEHQLDGREVVYDSTISGGRLPIWHESHETSIDDFWSMYVGFQRTGESMRVALQPKELFVGKAAVFVWPRQPIKDEVVDAAVQFVKRGGTLYVFDSLDDVKSSSNTLLAPFGLALGTSRANRRIALRQFSPSDDLLLVGQSRPVSGGIPIVVDEQGNAVVSRLRFGLGSVIVAGVAHEFAVARMGNPHGLRDVRAFDSMQLLYCIIDAGKLSEQNEVKPEQFTSTAR